MGFSSFLLFLVTSIIQLWLPSIFYMISVLWNFIRLTLYPRRSINFPCTLSYWTPGSSLNTDFAFPCMIFLSKPCVTNSNTYIRKGQREAFRLQNLHRQEIDWKNYSATNTGYLSWKSKDDSGGRTKNHREVFPSWGTA